MAIRRLYILALLLCLIGAALAVPSMASAQNLGREGAAKLPIADMHFHIMAYMDPAELLRRMDKNGVRWAGGVGMQPVEGKGKGSGGLEAAARREQDVVAVLGQRYVPAAGQLQWQGLRAQGGVEDSNVQGFKPRFAAMERQVSSGARAVGEIIVNKAGESFRTKADSENLKAMFNLAAKAGVVLNVHAEWASDTAQEIYGLAASNRAGRLVLAHCGHITSADTVRKILGDNPNILCDLSHRSAVDWKAGTPNGARIIFTASNLDTGWRQLIVDFADRFFAGTDDPDSWNDYDAIVQNMRFGLLANLPFEVAEKVAYKNAQAMFRLD